jgi:diguanylate cyclase (GGDEF)-like protein
LAHVKLSKLLTSIGAHPWASLRDFAVLSGILLFSVLIATHYDVFSFFASLAAPPRQISPAEATLLGCLGVSCVWIFISRRLADDESDAAIDPRQIASQLRELRELAMQDPLTSLPNRRVLTSAIETAMMSLPVGARAHAVFMLDLNGFKKVNDGHGHAVGDQALQAVVERFRRVTRSHDLLARLGGDEFALLARNVDVATAQAIGMRFINALDRDIRTDETTHKIGVAIGAALFPTDGGTAEQLLRHADLAMYRAKMEPHSALVFFHSLTEHRASA